jgi:hypothetical protein
MPPSEKPRSENTAAGPNPELLEKSDKSDKIVLLLVSGLQRSAVEEAAAKLGLEPAEIGEAIAEAKLRIAIAARWDRDEQLGSALIRLNDLYRRSLAIQDSKTALAAQKEINKLLELHRPSPATDGRAADLAGELAAARGQLTPLGLGDDTLNLPELCRRAVLKLLASNDRR